MLRRFIFGTLLLLLCYIKVSAQQKDSLLLYNGQVLIGEIQNAQLGEITIDDVDLKLLTVKLYKIKELKTSRRFKIETDDKVIYFGQLQPAARPGWIHIVPDGAAAIAIDITRLHLVVPLGKSFLSKLNGTLSAGFSYTKSSSVGQINLSSVTTYAARKFEYQLTVSANMSIDSSQFSRDREEAGLLAGYYVTPTWSVTASTTYQRNLELSLSRRYQQMVGAGNKLFIRKNWQLLAITGLTFNQERSTAGESSGLLLEIPVLLRYNFFQFHHPNIQISATPSGYFSLSQKGRIRYEGNVNFSWQLIRYFYLTLNPYANFDSQPPAGGSDFDYGVVLSISYKF